MSTSTNTSQDIQGMQDLTPDEASIRVTRGNLYATAVDAARALRDEIGGADGMIIEGLLMSYVNRFIIYGERPTDDDVEADADALGLDTRTAMKIAGALAGCLYGGITDDRLKNVLGRMRMSAGGKRGRRKQVQYYDPDEDLT